MSPLLVRHADDRGSVLPLCDVTGVSLAPPGSFGFGEGLRLPFRRIVAILGRPNSSSSSSNVKAPEPASSSSSSASHSSFVSRRKLVYVRRGGGDGPGLGGVLALREIDGGGGVRGRELPESDLFW